MAFGFGNTEVMGMLDQYNFSRELMTKAWLEWIKDQVGGRKK